MFSKKTVLFAEAIIGFTFLFIAGPLVTRAATITWTAPGAGNWSTGSNWSGGVAPGSGDTALFSASSTQNATIDTSVTVGAVQIVSGYTGTISQGSGNVLTVTSTAGFSQAAGTFTGSNANIVVGNGPFSLSGGTFTSTNATLQVGGNWTFSGGTFNNSSGTVMFPATLTVNGSSTFYNLSFSNSGYGAAVTHTVATGTVLTVTNAFNISPSAAWDVFLGGGEVDIRGNVYGQNGATGGPATGTVSFVLNGAGTQTLGTSTDVSVTFPNLTINKSGGSVNFGAPVVNIAGSWTNLSGTSISAGTSTILFAHGSPGVITGSSTFYNVQFGTSGMSESFTIATSTVITVQGYFMSVENYSAVSYYGGGEVDLQGDVMKGYDGAPSDGTAKFVINGTGNQTVGIDCTPFGNTCTYVDLPNLTIDKATGTLALRQPIYIYNTWTNMGLVPIDPGTSTVTIGFPVGSITGSSTFYGLSFNPDGINSSSITIATGTVVTVKGPYKNWANYSAPAALLGGGEIDVAGNIIGQYNPAAAVGTVSLVLNGTSTQVIGDTSQCGGCNMVSVANLTVNKSSGIASIPVPLTISGPLNVTSGELQIATTSAQNTIIASGTVTIASGGRFTAFPVSTTTIQFGSTVSNSGLILLDGSGAGCSSLPQNILLRSTQSGTQRGWSGTGATLIRYADVQDQGGSVTAYNSYNRSNNAWSFTNGGRPQVVQQITNSGLSAPTIATTTFAISPEPGDLVMVAVSARNQGIAAPTDNASNTYYLIASSTFGSSPSYSLALYYAKNVISTSTFTISVNGTNSLAGSMISMISSEFTGIAPSSSIEAWNSNTDTSGSATTLSTNSATGNYSNELYYGIMTLSASTTASAAPGWSASPVSVTDNAGHQALYAEYISTSTSMSAAATWTSATSTSYSGIIAVFRSIYNTAYYATGTLDSAIFDTGVASGTQLNSMLWRGTVPAGTAVKFQLAASASASGPWNYVGPDGTANTYFSGTSGSPISLYSTSNGYSLFNGYRYFRYRITLFSDPAQLYSPTVNSVVVNWSP